MLGKPAKILVRTEDTSVEPHEQKLSVQPVSFLSTINPSITIQTYNGYEWSNVSIIKTLGYHMIMEVYVALPKFVKNNAHRKIICEASHPFIMEDGKRLYAVELEPGFKLRDWKLPLTDEIISCRIESVTEPIKRYDCLYSIAEEKTRSVVINDVMVGTSEEYHSRSRSDIIN